MIGFFDSGFGGLTVMREVVKLLPQYSYIYLGDNLRTPYGTRSQEEIFEFTRQGVEYLFGQGAELVIVACNTSSSSALRRIQREVLPKKYPGKRVLGIIVPTAEDFGQFTEKGAVGVLATPATVEACAYNREVAKFWPGLKFFQQACPKLVPLIEAGDLGDGLDRVIGEYLDALLGQTSEIDAIVLGCTHYAIIEDRIRRLAPSSVRIISQGMITAQKTVDYLKRHSDIEVKIDRRSRRTFLSTDNSEKVRRLAQIFYGEPIEVDLAELG